MFLNQAFAKALDVELMQVPGFSLDQLMELAGLSVACAVADVFRDVAAFSRILTIAGPGNNGGDALVAARHLKHFGYQNIEVLYPKRTETPALFPGLVAQLNDLDIPFIPALPADFESKYDLILDGIFGFSFNPSSGVRPPFDTILKSLRTTKLPIVSIDIPSGWDVEKGDIHQLGIGMPHLLVSLTAPKLCARTFTGPHHYLGGRFLPPALAKRYGLTELPKYKGSDQCVRISSEDVERCDKKEKLDTSASGAAAL